MIELLPCMIFTFSEVNVIQFHSQNEELTNMNTHQGRRNVFGMGGGIVVRKFFLVSHLNIKSIPIFLLYYICDYQNPLSHAHG